MGAKRRRERNGVCVFLETPSVTLTRRVIEFQSREVAVLNT